MTLALEARELSKSFGALRALDRASLRLGAGTVHALLGENGAGKSTLVKCIMGYHQPDAGQVLLGGRPVRIGNPREAQALGLGMVYQHFTLVPNMTVAENLVLARARLPAVIDWRRELRALEAALEGMPFPVDLRAEVRTLSAGDRQKLEITKQLYLRSRVVILDEPTSVLTPAEGDEVLGRLRALARAGGISVLLITHRFREVMAFADEVTVLRRGRLAGAGRVPELSPDALAEMMVGATTSPPTEAPRRAGRPGEPRLRLDALEADDDAGVPALRGVSLDVRAGEIVAVAGVAGNGQEALVEVLAGQRPARAGRVHVSREEYRGSRGQQRRHRFRCLPEEPLRGAAVPAMTVAENLALRAFDRPPFTTLRWGLRPSAIRAAALPLIAGYGVRPAAPDVPLGELSGGNVQRAALARELDGDPAVLVIANPCMGLDFSAVAEVHARLRAARDRGAAVLLVSADLDEVFALADRVVDMNRGRIVHETPIAGAEVGVIGRHMAGHP